MLPHEKISARIEKEAPESHLRCTMHKLVTTAQQQREAQVRRITFSRQHAHIHDQITGMALSKGKTNATYPGRTSDLPIASGSRTSGARIPLRQCGSYSLVVLLKHIVFTGDIQAMRHPGTPRLDSAMHLASSYHVRSLESP